MKDLIPLTLKFSENFDKFFLKIITDDPWPPDPDPNMKRFTKAQVPSPGRRTYRIIAIGLSVQNDWPMKSLSAFRVNNQTNDAIQKANSIFGGHPEPFRVLSVMSTAIQFRVWSTRSDRKINTRALTGTSCDISCKEKRVEHCLAINSTYACISMCIRRMRVHL